MEGPIQRAWWFCAVVVLVVGMFGLVASMVVVAEPAGAATVLFVAATGSDTNPCSAAAPCATITHALSSLPATIEVAGTVDDNASISSTVTIEQWSGQSPAVVDGRGLGSVFTVLPAGNLTVDRLTLTGGSAVSGGGINSSGTATIIDCTIASNSAIADLSGAGYGGGIVSTGPLTITDSTITNNTAAGGGIADGGGIVNSGPLTITDSTISDNSATTSAPGGSALGGAIYNEIGPLTIAGSTIAGNTATGPNTARGGAIYNTGTVNITATLNITTSTLTSNSVGSSIAVGGAIDNGGTATITTSTITSNTTSGSGASFVSGGGGLMNEPSSRLTVADSTIAGNSVAATGLGGESGGGGLDNNGTASVTDSTITGNSANDRQIASRRPSLPPSWSTAAPMLQIETSSEGCLDLSPQHAWCDCPPSTSGRRVDGSWAVRHRQPRRPSTSGTKVQPGRAGRPTGLSDGYFLVSNYAGRASTTRGDRRVVGDLGFDALRLVVVNGP